MIKFISGRAATLVLAFALSGCASTNSAPVENAFDRMPKHSFVFEGETWLIGYREDYGLFSPFYATWLKRPNKSLGGEDYQVSINAASFFMSEILKCPAGQKIGPVAGGGLSGPDFPGVMNVRLKCFDEKSFDQ